jgi:uncharacterized protein (TIGR02246 family)
VRYGLICIGITLLACADQREATRVAHRSQDGADVTAIRHVVDDWVAGYNAGSIDRVMDVYDSDIVEMYQGGPTDVGKTAIAAAYKGMIDPNNGHLAAQTDEIQVFGDIAFLRGTFDLVMTPKSGGEAHEIRRRQLAILRKATDGRWRIIRSVSLE